jgi:energy-coupling factor transporter ATP-binding protein EcfA2
LPEISIRGLRYSYPPQRPGGESIRVLSDVNLEVERGEFLSIMGPTGAGKTTLCLALNGIVPHSAGGRFGGDVVVAGLNTREHPVALLASRVGVVFQDAESQLFNMTVEDEVAFGPESLGVPRREIGERVAWALAAVGMTAHRGRSPLHLSGGQKQRVAIAAMLAMLPRILVLDEPTAGLDPAGKVEVFGVIDGLRRDRQITAILVEQESEKVAEFSDRVAVLHGGRIALIGSPAEVFSQVDRLHEMGVAVPQVSELANLLNSHRGTRYVFTTLDGARQALASRIASPEETALAGAFPRRPLVTTESVVHLSRVSQARDEQNHPSTLSGSTELTVEAPPEGETLHHLHPVTNSGCSSIAPPARPDLCIQIRDLWYRYDGESDALCGISLDIEDGDLLALVGQNGSGKTTLAKHFNGLLKPTRGTVRVYGQDTAELRVGQLARQVGYVFQNPDHQIFSPTVREEIAFGPKNLGLAPDEVDRRITETLARFRLEAYADVPPALLGYGLRRQVGVAAVYAMYPRVFVLDEPTAGLDWQGVQELMALLGDMNAEGHTIILITHDMRLVAAHARRIVVLHKGQMIASGDTPSVFQRTDLLVSADIELPQIAQLARQLASLGLEMPQDVLTVRAFHDAYEICLDR